jgi:tetratricopeptide (TPR) repeat protein
MKLRAAKPTLWAWMAAAGLSGAPLAVPPEAESDVAEMVARLSDDSFQVREGATRDLWKLGDQALVELQRAAGGEDPEAATRARELMRKIELGILPDSSPLIVDLVMRYDRGNLAERRTVIGELKSQRAWRQILKLYALEKDEDSIAELEPLVRGVAIDAARDCIVGEGPDIAGALSYLKMARPEASDFMAMASLHRLSGTLAEEIEKAKSQEGKDAHLWRYALHAAAGDLTEASAEADLAGLEMTAARLQLLTGDPLPWIKVAPAPPQTISATALPSYREFAMRRWQGKEIKPDTMRQLRRMARGGDEDDQAKSIRLLFLAGDHAEAEKLMASHDPTAAFYYFESSERIEEALKVYGLDPQKPDYKAWALKRFRVLIDEPDEEENELQELAMLGYFLERRGMKEVLQECYVVPLEELARTDQEIFLRTASRLFSGPYGSVTASTAWPVLQAVATYAGDDEVRWMQIVESLFDNYRTPDRLWTWLGTVKPELGHLERLELQCRLYDRLPDPENERGKFFDDAWAAIGKAEGIDRMTQLGQFLDLSNMLNIMRMKDSPNFLRGLELLAKEDEEAASNRFSGNHLMAVGRWAEAAEEWMRVVKLRPDYTKLRAYAAACYRRAGNESAAAAQERIAELMAMGETEALYDCAGAFALTGDFERANTWWQRAAVECTTDTDGFLQCITYLSQQAFSEGDWKRAAAFSEVLALQEAMAGGAGYGIPVTYGFPGDLRMRIDADFARAFANLGKDRASSVATIKATAAMPFADLSLADSFFTPMREAGLVKEHDEAFERIWGKLVERIQAYPENDNTRNSAAWLASRANRRIDEAAVYLEKALENHPRQAAYLDTMAEVQFARRDREKAIEFSTRGMIEESEDLQLIRQHERFKSGPFPPK